VVGALGAFLTVAFLAGTVVVVIAVCVQLSRKKEEVPTVEYEVVGPPQLPPRIDPFATDVNVVLSRHITMKHMPAPASMHNLMKWPGPNNPGNPHR